MYEKKVMGVSEFKSLKGYFKKADHISLSGLAEPLINKNIVEFIKIIKEESKQCSVSICSNGNLLTDELSASLVESKLDTFEFSLDGVIPDARISCLKAYRKCKLNRLSENVKLQKSRR